MKLSQEQNAVQQKRQPETVVFFVLFFNKIHIVLDKVLYECIINYTDV